MLDVLRSVIQEVSRAGDLNSVLNIIVERVQEAMETDVCSVYLVDDRDQRLVFMATRGLNQEAVGKVSLGPMEGLVGYVAERAEPLNLEDAQNHPRNILFAEIDEEPFHARALDQLSEPRRRCALRRRVSLAHHARQGRLWFDHDLCSSRPGNWEGLLRSTRELVGRSH